MLRRLRVGSPTEQKLIAKPTNHECGCHPPGEILFFHSTFSSVKTQNVCMLCGPTGDSPINPRDLGKETNS